VLSLNSPTQQSHTKSNETKTKPQKLTNTQTKGFTQSGPSFHAKTRALEKNLTKAFPSGITLHYPTAPHRLAPADIPFPLPSSTSNDSDAPEEVDAWAWWRRKDISSDNGDPYTYEGLEKGISSIADVLKTEGPFDGVIGFSQGGACAGIVASLLESGRKEAFGKDGIMPFPESFAEGAHPPLKFAVSYSGFAPRDLKLYRGFYEPKITTPMLHVLGTLDAVVEEAKSLALVEACKESEGRVVYHPGGHFLPASQKAYVGALIGFMKEVLDKAENGEKKEESVEDMDVPF
jgi:predicted esterase